MARNAIDSKSALNLNGMQHSYPGARSNFFYDFSATGERDPSVDAVRDSLSAVWFLWLLIQLNWFLRFNFDCLVNQMNVCLILDLIVRFISFTTLYLHLCTWTRIWICICGRGSEQTQAAAHGLRPIFERPSAEWRWTERRRGNATEGESEVIPLGTTHTMCDFVISVEDLSWNGPHKFWNGR